MKLKRILRFLQKRPTTTYLYEWQDHPGELTGYTDSDWASCKLTRRSTSGGAIQHGSHLLLHYSLIPPPKKKGGVEAKESTREEGKIEEEMGRTCQPTMKRGKKGAQWVTMSEDAESKQNEDDASVEEPTSDEPRDENGQKKRRTKRTRPLKRRTSGATTVG